MAESLKDFWLKTNSSWNEGDHYHYRSADEYFTEKSKVYIKELEERMKEIQPLLTELHSAYWEGWDAAKLEMLRLLRGETK